MAKNEDMAAEWKADSDAPKKSRKPRGPAKVSSDAVAEAARCLADVLGDGAAVEFLADDRLLIYGNGTVLRSDEPVKGRVRQLAVLEGVALGLRYAAQRSGS